jgi:predicted nucleotidyltransferase
VTELDLRGLVAVLHDHEVRYTIIGAVAVGAHGHIRATQDLDIVPAAESLNIKRLSSALVALDATLPNAEGRAYVPERDEAQLHVGASATFETRLGDFDVVQRVPGVVSWAELEEDSIESDILGVPVKVCSLEHLRQMKQARGLDRDLLDLKELEGL